MIPTTYISGQKYIFYDCIAASDGVVAQQQLSGLRMFFLLFGAIYMWDPFR